MRLYLWLFCNINSKDLKPSGILHLNVPEGLGLWYSNICFWAFWDGCESDGWCQLTGMRNIGCGDLGDNVKQERGEFCRWTKGAAGINSDVVDVEEGWGWCDALVLLSTLDA